jgi:1-acyl-sn-glycerol-3-phosphate acyltransferase
MKHQTPQINSFLYALLKPWVKLGATCFFSRIEIRNLQRMPLNRPVILVANHQNAMLDPVLICLFAPSQLHWLTRADIFRKPAVDKLLRNLNMLPVYRERDRVADIADRNKATFEQCYLRLQHHAVICIFPEGTHRGKKQLVPLKKGLARMIAGAPANVLKDLVIQPVGLDYENYYEYRKKLVINFGNPLSAADLIGQSGSHHNQTLSSITQNTAQSLIDLMIHISNDDVYHEIMALQPLSEKISSKSQPGTAFDTFKFWSDTLDNQTQWHSWLNHEVARYRRLMHELRINETQYRERFSRMNILALILGLPFVCIALVVFYPIFFVAESTVKSLVKDPLFRNSIRLVVWTFLTPLMLILIAAILGLICSGWLWALSGAIITVMSGLITLRWIEVWKLYMHHRKCVRYRKSGNALFGEWTTIRKNIINQLMNLKTGN